MTTSVSIRLEMLRNSVLNKLGPGLGRLVTSDVYVELLPDQEQPSLFGDSLNPELHEQAV